MVRGTKYGLWQNNFTIMINLDKVVGFIEKEISYDPPKFYRAVIYDTGGIIEIPDKEFFNKLRSEFEIKYWGNDKKPWKN